MRLKQIKLAGFKSFVDPTKIPFEQDMTAIVGPNGCGKSNIIDAVRWVLGESSAKNLRGDAMTDVIFNGASSRKLVGQASVELFFENIQGRIQGSMADRNEISIRRVVNRDGANRYFLNGSKCRRRDITDIFLGTGLGPRSYAIIEQGTISRLIESKPQELRVFIEEAAGISKYKERRRETENRIRHTRENLERLCDIRNELSMQIDKLHQQSEAAKRYKILKSQERKLKAELLVLKWQKCDEKHRHFDQQVIKAQNKISDLNIEASKNDVELFLAKQQMESSSEELGLIQQQKLALSSNIARLEQTLKHHKQEQKTVDEDVKQLVNQINLLTEKRVNANKLVQQSQHTLQQNTPDLLLVEQQLEQARQTLLTTQSELELLQSQWDCHLEQSAKVNTQKIQLENKQASQQLSRDKTDSRMHDIRQSLDHLQTKTQESELKGNQQAAELCQQKLGELTSEQEEVDQRLAQVNEQHAELEQCIAKQLGSLDALKINLSQLEKQQSNKPGWLKKQQQWLLDLGISNHGSVFEHIVVNEKWQDAVECVLTDRLNATLIDSVFDSDIPENLALVNILMSPPADEVVETQSGSLAEKVSGTTTVNKYLNQVFVAEDIEHARQLLAELKSYQSVICPDTTWIGHHFLRKGLSEHADNLLENQSLLMQLKDKVTFLLDEIASNEQRLKQIQNEKISLSASQQTMLQQQNCLVSEINAIEQKQALFAQQQQYDAEQVTLLQNELEQLQKQRVSDDYDCQVISQQLHDLEKEIAQKTSDSELRAKKQTIQDDSKRLQSEISQLHDKRHQIALIVEQAKHAYQQSLSSIEEIERQILQLNEQKNTVALRIDKSEQSLKNDEQNLQKQLTKMVDIDKQLLSVEKKRLLAQQKISEFEQHKQARVARLDHYKEQIAQFNLDAESFRLRAENAQEQLLEMQQSIESVQAQMPDNVNESTWQAQLIRLAKDISQLGIINLAAIDEYETQYQRKVFLDQQDQDLNNALDTLESVISKIDRESRSKFKETFDKVNNDLKLLFPKVFGGGVAYLELTGEDLLDTGVTIMARPPGKKNSTIHLLSGGEKALTALSLVFAIFRLNPAPFCMLDEVDAPLDDANVERFCNLVREMSHTVQFIYISHNKIAMEMASHLTGVTMFEAGVSRMVAVDIDEAIAMAEVS